MLIYGVLRTPYIIKYGIIPTPYVPEIGYSKRSDSDAPVDPLAISGPVGRRATISGPVPPARQP